MAQIILPDGALVDNGNPTGAVILQSDGPVFQTPAGGGGGGSAPGNTVQFLMLLGLGT